MQRCLNACECVFLHLKNYLSTCATTKSVFILNTHMLVIVCSSVVRLPLVIPVGIVILRNVSWFIAVEGSLRVVIRIG